MLHWGRESNPELEWFRQEIRKAYGGRAPKVLDPFAGGGAIPLEAMRLGCEATAIDINPVAWFILKCTLEYPQKLAGQHRPLPQFALESPEFMESSSRARQAHEEAARTEPSSCPVTTLPGAGRRPRLARPRLGLVGTAEGKGGSEEVLPDDRRQADGRVSVGADGHLQELSSDGSPPKNALALQEGQEAGTPDDEPEL